MFLAARFEGEPTTLLAGHARLLELIPAQDLHLHVCAPHPAGLEVYDACPSREVFEGFSTSADFRQALSHAGLPSPTVQPIREIASLFLHGKRIV